MRAISSVFLLVAFMLIAPMGMGQTSATQAVQAEVDVLRAQLETMRFFHNSFMSIAIWALGAAVTIALALAVFNWFTNRANYQRDKELIVEKATALREELTGIVAQKTAEAREELDKGLSARQLTLQQSIERALQPKLDKLQSEIKDAVETALGLQAELAIRDADEAADEKSYGWAIYKYCEALDTYRELQTDFYQAAEVLDKLSKILKTPGISVDADTVSKTVQTLQRLPKQHHPVTESLIGRVKTLLK